MTIDDYIASHELLRPLEASTRDIYKLTLAGHGPTAISRKLGVTKNTVCARVFRMRVAGVLPPARIKHSENQRVELMRRKYNKRIGTVTHIINALTEEQSEWVYANVPDKATVADFIVSLVRDAYAEENN